MRERKNRGTLAKIGLPGDAVGHTLCPLHEDIYRSTVLRSIARKKIRALLMVKARLFDVPLQAKSSQADTFTDYTSVRYKTMPKMA